MLDKGLFPIILFLFTLEINALPEGSVSVNGGGGINISGKEMSVTAPDGSIFEHQTFNLAPDETVRFVQPTSDAHVLNRILSAETSLVDGSIIGNGKVFFASPAGLIFGENAVVDVGKLHVIAGNISDENFLSGNYSYDQLLGSIENRGLIRAREVVFAGNKVINSGRISSPSGDTFLLAGDGLQINSNDGRVSIELSQENIVQEHVASDFAGQAVLQSGIIEAGRVHVSADAIELSGEIVSDEVSISKFSFLSNSQGKMESNLLSLEPRTITDGAIARLEGNQNNISSIQLLGSFYDLRFRTLNDTQLVGVERETNSIDFYIQHADFRTTNGSLIISARFAPVYSNLPSTFLAAADKDLSIVESGLSYAFDQATLFGKNINNTFLDSRKDIPDDWHFLSTYSLDIDNLKIGLDPSSVLILAAENPNFTGFSNGLPGIVGIDDYSSNVVSELPSIPNIPELSIPSNQPTGSSIVGDIPSDYPNSSGITDFHATDNIGLSFDQLKIAMDYGLFSTYSYIIELKDVEVVEDIPISLEDQISELGGTAALFGGSYQQVQSSTDSSVGAESMDEGQSEDSETDEQNEDSASENASTETGEGSSSSSSPVNVAVGVAPFAPISRPIYSPEAAALLDAALSPQILENLQKFIGR